MVPIERLLVPGHRPARQEDMQKLFELISKSFAESNHSGVIVHGIHGNWLKGFEFFATGPFSLRNGCCMNDFCIIGRDAHTLYEMHLRIVDILEQGEKSFADIKYFNDGQIQESFGEVRLYLPKEQPSE